MVGWSRQMLYSGFNILSRSVIRSANSIDRSDNSDVIHLLKSSVIVSRTRKQFSLKSLVVCVAILGGCLGGYCQLRSDSHHQLAIVAEFESQRGGFWQSAETPFRFGHWFGLKYPIDSVRAIKGPERADWGMVPGWECTKDSIRLLKHFRNVETVYFSNSTFDDDSVRHVLSLPKLDTLEFYNCDLSECTMSAFANAPALRSIKFRGSNCKNGSVDELRRLAPYIELSGIGG